MKNPEKFALYLGDAKDILDIKTANGFRYWRSADCVGEIALQDCTVTTGLPRMDLEEARSHGAARLIIGVTPHGGVLKEADIPVIQHALSLGYIIISGLHAKLGDTESIRTHAAYSPERVVELRNTAKNVIGTGRKRAGKRLLTIGTDCCVGKMYTALTIHQALQARGVSCTFRATGQTGIMIAGDGVCVDALVSDFVAGNVEMLTKDNDPDHWDIIEGQGSLYHPAYAGVTLGLLHGSQPDALVVCHEWGRTVIDGTRYYRVPSLREIIDLNLVFARMVNPSAKVVGISMNTRRLRDHEKARKICEETEQELGLPCVDVIRDGVESLIPNILR